MNPISKPASVTKSLLVFLNILAWVIFVGLCIVAGAFWVNVGFAALKPDAVKYLWQQANLSSLFSSHRGHFISHMVLLSVVATLKAVLFYFIVEMLSNKKLTILKPFNTAVERFIIRASLTSLLIGLLSLLGKEYSDWFTLKGIEMPSLEAMHLDGGDVWLLMSVTLFIIAQVFKKGIELQEEQELTV